MSIKIDPTIESSIKKVRSIARSQVPFATAKALTITAKEVQSHERKEMERVFDRPTRFTLNSLFIKPARKTDLKAFIGLKDKIKGQRTQPADYLKAQVDGGKRKAKASEKRLRLNNLIGSNEAFVPSKELKLNKFGNITRGRIQTLLDGAQVGTKSPYFVATINGTKALWQRRGRKARKIKPLLIVVNTLPDYTSRFDFYDSAIKKAKEVYPTTFNRTLLEALRTAK